MEVESIKFYSDYSGPSDWQIMTAEERDKCMRDKSVRENGQVDYYRFMFPHKTFSDAKGRVLMNIIGDSNEIKLSKMRIQSLRASDFRRKPKRP